MNQKIQEIKSGEGLGQLKFGMSTNQVKQVIGEPDEVETYSYETEEGELSETWHYDSLELSISFDEEEDWKLVSIAISAADITFKGHKLIGLKRDELIKILEGLDIGHLEYEDWSSAESPNHKLISAEDVEINFWLDDDELTEIQLGPLFDDNDDIKWPKIA
ncbi:outer membrane protein assembly factor BamE [Fulvivirga ulvae]|uniref:outer membrane protein assembly factor BamE n=1 Tax=Fulvivirga ulvae TaxID=2904245 RepID=UPI001F1E611A|nr:outer membrane protein assembly factor BamE [Fulvivirga ulvae]UII30648.1 outer membrane protein assembly factor BamE [Fulvivirga ulvae]